jgi:hypothetical protein
MLKYFFLLQKHYKIPIATLYNPQSNLKMIIERGFEIHPFQHTTITFDESNTTHHKIIYNHTICPLYLIQKKMRE